MPVLIRDFNYTLPPERIAQYPLTDRDASRLLLMRDGIISEDVFRNIGNYLPADSLLVFNDTRVIRARLIFTKSTGASIEIFCLEPIAPEREIQVAFLQPRSCTWKCLAGNVKRWKEGLLKKEMRTPGGEFVSLSARLNGPEEDGCFSVTFQWDPPEKSFAEILFLAGLVPLPPYISRETDPSDAIRYQTIYATHDGSVAAPTAGLHFTGQVLKKLELKGYSFVKVTLHVGVGTFRPVTTPGIEDHVMHGEKIVVSRETLNQILRHIGSPIVAVGTTSARTLESLYWLGVKLINSGFQQRPCVDQWDPYKPGDKPEIPVKNALEALLSYLEYHELNEYTGETRLMIVPGYKFRLLSALITNFHMPQSTLLLLVGALVGDDWKNAYAYALKNGFRFLSYGDSCLFFKS